MDQNRLIPLNPSAGHPAAGGDVDADADADAFVRRAADACAVAGGGAPRRAAAAHHTAVLAGAANHSGTTIRYLTAPS